MCADRALEGSRLADIGVAAVPADPHLLFLTGKDLALLEVGGKGALTCLLCDAGKVGVLVAGHALACKSFHQVLLGLGSLEFHNLFSSQIV